MNPLGDLSPARFLEEHWQKKPLFVANAFPEFALPDYSPAISPDELAGLACEDDVEARLVLEQGGSQPWELRHGPFTDADFAKLPETHWTLLIQECNKYVPELARLLELFNFIPNWRIDDIMVSYAPEYGSVGPHTDQYDVFLIQGLGRRRWQIDSHVSPDAKHIPDIDLAILDLPESGYQWEQEWIANPGDMLYLPPGVAHYGVAMEDCMTFSVGFRAASHYELLSDFVDYTGEQKTEADPKEQLRYSDPGLELQAHPGEITQLSLNQVEKILYENLSDKEAISHWFGRFATQPKNEIPDLSPEHSFSPAQLIEQLESGQSLLRSEYSRFAFITYNNQETGLFIDGNEISLTGDTTNMAALVCDKRELNYQEIADHTSNNDFIELLTALVNTGKLYFADDE